MKKTIRIIPMWILMFCPYIYILDSVMYGGKREIAGVPLFYLYCAFVIVVCVINWINAFTYKCEKIAKDLACWSMMIKLAHIPFFILVYLFGILMLPSMLFVPMTFITPIIILILVVIDLLFMITSSAYTIKGVWTAKKQDIVSQGFAIVLTIFSFVFVVDVICAILLYRKIKQRCNIQDIKTKRLKK